MPGATLDSSEIVNQFNLIVRNNAYLIGIAPRHSGSTPGGADSRLGSQSEILHNASELDGRGYLAATVVFNILHAWAMELTRVRRVHFFHLVNASYEDRGRDLTALRPEYAVYFPIPYQPAIGAPVTALNLNTFLNNLRTEVNKVRSTNVAAYEVDIVTCHSNCHSSCHGSRNRR